MGKAAACRRLGGVGGDAAAGTRNRWEGWREKRSVVVVVVVAVVAVIIVVVVVVIAEHPCGESGRQQICHTRDDPMELEEGVMGWIVGGDGW